MTVIMVTRGPDTDRAELGQMNVASFRPRPDKIEAVQVFWENRHEVAQWCGGEAVPDSDLAPSGILYRWGILCIRIGVLGERWAQDGDWVVKDAKGEVTFYKPVSFAEAYEKIENV